MMRLQRSNQGTVRVVHLTEGQQSVALHDGICGPPGVERSPDWNPALPMLLLPAGYRVKDPNTAPALMSELVLVSIPGTAGLDTCSITHLPRNLHSEAIPLRLRDSYALMTRSGITKMCQENSWLSY